MDTPGGSPEGGPGKQRRGAIRWGAAARWAPAAIWMGVIFVLSHQSDLAAPGGIALPDKAWHALIYAVLGALLWWAMAAAPAWAGPARALAAIGIGAGYGLADEVHQRFVAGRQYDLADWAFDIIGLSAGLLLALTAAHLRRRGAK